MFEPRKQILMLDSFCVFRDFKYRVFKRITFYFNFVIFFRYRNWLFYRFIWTGCIFLYF